MSRPIVQNKIQKSTLYRVVFDAVAVRYLVAFMFMFFVMHPAVPAFASEDAPEEVVVEQEPEVVEEVADDKPEPEVSSESDGVPEVAVVPDLEESSAESVQESEVPDLSEEESEEGEGPSGSEVAVDTEEEPAEEVPSEESQQEETQVVESIADTPTASSDGGSGSSSDAPTEDEVSESNGVEETSAEDDLEAMSKLLASAAEETDEENVVPDESEVDGASTSTASQDISEDDVQNVASTTDAVEDIVQTPEQITDTETPQEIVNEEPADESEVVEEMKVQEESEQVETTDEPVENEPIQLLTNDQNRYQFGDSECVSVGEGAFYCSKITDTHAQDVDGVYAESDADGDREIFLRKGGAIIKITDNLFEDAAPSYDTTTDEIVFHRLIEGRYQIIRYSLDTKEETQLTASRENSMEPVQVDGVVVWQQWVTDNWEIALLESGDVTVITGNGQHDVAPTIRDGYVMWHTTDASGEKLLSVYEIATGISSSVSDPDGGHVENPRFVLVYDTTFDNGDVVTKEYDPKTGEVRPIGTNPSVPLPAELPPPDGMDETSALLNIKTSSRDEGVEDFDVASLSKQTSSSTPDISIDASATTTEQSTIGDVVDVSTLDLATSTSEVLELTDFDLIVEPYMEATSTTDSIQETEAATSSESGA